MAQIVPHPAARPAVIPVPAPAPAAGVTHVDALPPGTRLSEFEVQGLLGVGGFGLVYRAYDTSLLRTVAIKEYMPAALAARLGDTTVAVRSSSDQGTYQSGLQSFIAEARLLAQFDHPSLVKVYRFFEANNTAYMVMPLYSGMTLKEARSLMAAPPPETWLRSVLWSVLQGLHVLHRNDTLHRDVSPDNIFLQDVGPPVLLDLGAARRAITDKSQKVTAVLKVNYAPIEQFAESDDLKQGAWTDLYALAAVVYSCLRNDPPMPATVRVVRDSQPSVRSVVAAVKEHFGLAYSDEFVRTIQHALAVQPADRPQSLAAFVTEMKLKAPPRLSKFDWRAEIGSSLKTEDEYNSRQFWHTQPHAASEAPAGKAVRASRKQRWGWPVLAGGVLLAGAGLIWALMGNIIWREAGSRVARPEAVAPAPVTPAAEPVASPAGADGSAPAPTGPVVEAEAAKPVPEPPSKPAPKPVPKRSESAARPATPRSASVEERKPVARPVVTESRPAPAVVSPPPVVAPKELCADANFFYKPMCIHQECKKPENRTLPVCVEDRQRYPEAGG